MPHTIVTDVCEGVADCVNACPVACIHEGPGKNVKGTDWYWIDFATCIDCGICLQVCPVENAILAEERPELQKIAAQSEVPESRIQNPGNKFPVLQLKSVKTDCFSVICSIWNMRFDFLINQSFI